MEKKGLLKGLESDIMRGERTAFNLNSNQNVLAE